MQVIIPTLTMRQQGELGYYQPQYNAEGSQVQHTLTNNKPLMIAIPDMRFIYFQIRGKRQAHCGKGS